MALTAKEEKFAQCIADGMTQADAYRSAFSVRPNTKPETIHESASRVRKDPEVSARIDDLKAMLTAKALWTREDSVRVLMDIAQAQGEKAKASDAVAAVKELNAMHGFNAPAKMELSGELNQNITRIELVPLNGNS